MKKLVILVLLLAVAFAGCTNVSNNVKLNQARMHGNATHSNGQGRAMMGNGQGAMMRNGQKGIIMRNGSVSVHTMWNEVMGIKAGNLTPQEIKDILYMRQEEKLAHDVYITLYNKWHLQIFKNIANSEQTHMDAVKMLIEKYNLTDPDKGKGIGEFENPNFIKLYRELVAEGNKSVLDALKVGAMIEELDIVDLQHCLNNTNKSDIKIVFENLMKGSRNHLRAFVSNMERMGYNYKPKYLSEEEFKQIISSGTERGPAK